MLEGMASKAASSISIIQSGLGNVPRGTSATIHGHRALLRWRGEGRGLRESIVAALQRLSAGKQGAIRSG